jgi:hypothetical protein
VTSTRSHRRVRSMIAPELCALTPATGSAIIPRRSTWDRDRSPEEALRRQPWAEQGRTGGTWSSDPASTGSTPGVTSCSEAGKRPLGSTPAPSARYPTMAGTPGSSRSGRRRQPRYAPGRERQAGYFRSPAQPTGDPGEVGLGRRRGLGRRHRSLLARLLAGFQRRQATGQETCPTPSVDLFGDPSFR